MNFTTISLARIKRLAPSAMWSTVRIASISRRVATWQTIRVVVADNYMKDTRDWPDPTEPRASKPPAPEGCTCPFGQKLECPVHGLHGSQEDLDNQWANIQQANPVGYPQDAPRTWQQAYSHRVALKRY